MATVEFFYDVVSPYSYLASTRIEAIAADCGAQVLFRPFFLGGLMKAVGNTPPAFLPPRGAYMFKDLQRWGRYYGVPVRVPKAFPPNSLLAQRALMAADPVSRVPLTHALFHLTWGEGRDIADADLVGAIVGPELLAAAQTPDVKAALTEATAEAQRRGAFGAPTFFVGDELFFGNDRLPFLEQHLRDVRG
jgi:2-hydroxychromene-2-carboxylate isomerase